jgi:hypothetical protein
MVYLCIQNILNVIREITKKWENNPDFNKKVYTPQMSFIQESRIIKHWEKMGVIHNKDTIENKWTKYTIYELLWINLVSEMRDFGLQLPRIKDVFNTIVGAKPGQWETLVYHIIYEEPNIEINIIIGKKEIYLFINNIARFWIGDELVPNNDIVKPQSFIEININSILEKVLRTEELPLTGKFCITYLTRKLDKND